MCALLGDAEAGALCTALTQTAPIVSVRTNPAKPAPLDGLLASTRRVPWCASGHYLPERPAFTFDPLLHAGAYYVQEAASMLVEQAYRAIARDLLPARLLDLCAAPGGKSTLWRALLPDEALLVANEPMRNRAQILAENLCKWGHPNVVVTNDFPADFAPFAAAFDVIAADVPCSGEGMFRKDAEARAEWSAEAVVRCAERQRGIVSDIWPCLREGGYFVYSTCTYNREENEDTVAWICRALGAELVPLDVPAEWGFVGDKTGRGLEVYHAFPHRVKGEGFFLALLRKTSDTPAARLPKVKSAKSAPIAQPEALLEAIENGANYRLFRPTPDTITAIPAAHFDLAQALHAHLHCLTLGVLLAEEKGRKRIPQHALALSTALRREAVALVPLDRPTALSYLRREAISLPPETPRGHVVVTIEGLPLGWVNNLGTRANNLYPQEWRIKSRVES